MPHDRRTTLPLRRRLLWSVGLAVGAVVGATVIVPSYGDASGAGTGDRSRSLVGRYIAERTARDVIAAESEPHTHESAGLDVLGLDGHAHVHNDPTTKNAISRSDQTSATTDPTTAAERDAAVAAVRAQRQE